MPGYVAFRLAAPLAAFGEIAVGERRPTADRPTRSAILGLLGAALGLDRNDEDGQAGLSAMCRVAIRVEQPGRLLVDYHTIQTPRPGRQPYATRAEELRADRIETILSRRDYRTDFLATVAIEVAESGRWKPADLEAALRTPRYILSLGRRSCPVCLPLAPLVIDAPDVLEAFVAYDAQEPENRRKFRKRAWLLASPRAVAAEPGMLPEGRAGTRLESRRDRVVHHRRRQFALRDEVLLPVDRPTEVSP
jgi:CRISPR system Cascade subunit CasD